MFAGMFMVQAQKGLSDNQFIFPPQEQHTHSSSIVQLPNGDFMACWFQGSGERKANDVKIMGARLNKKAKVWGKPFLLVDTSAQPDCNPVLFVDPKGRLVLYWIVVQANQWETSVLKYRRSSDFLGDGAPKWDWQDVILLKPGEAFADQVEAQFKAQGGRGLAWAEYAPRYETMVHEAAQDKKKRETGWMSRIQPLVLPSGRILLPLYSDGFNFSLVAISDDTGETWQPSLPIVGYGNIQPSLVRRSNGDIVAYMRDNGDAPGRILVSTSKDQGDSWSFAQKSELKNPGTSVQVLPLTNGHWLMVYNNTEDGRHNLAVALSKNEGKNWSEPKYLEQKEKGHGSFSYPTAIQAKDGKVHITYSHSTNGQETIKHVSFSPKWLQK